MILRSMYDTCLQLMYLAKDPTIMASKAEDVEDFYLLEEEKRLKDLMDTTAPYLEPLKNDPQILKKEKWLDDQISRAKDKADKDKNFKRSWYRKNLRWLASEVGLENEYLMVIKELHVHVHASPWSLAHPPKLGPYVLLYFVSNLVARSLKATADCLQVKFGRQIQKKLEEDSEDITLSQTGGLVGPHTSQNGTG